MDGADSTIRARQTGACQFGARFYCQYYYYSLGTTCQFLWREKHEFGVSTTARFCLKDFRTDAAFAGTYVRTGKGHFVVTGNDIILPSAAPRMKIINLCQIIMLFHHPKKRSCRLDPTWIKWLRGVTTTCVKSSSSPRKQTDIRAFFPRYYNYCSFIVVAQRNKLTFGPANKDKVHSYYIRHHQYRYTGC